MLVYLYTFVAAVFVSAAFTYLVRNTAVAQGLTATPVYGKHTHTQPLPRLGGVAIFGTFLLAALTYIPVAQLLHFNVPKRGYLGILVSALLIFLMGTYDDLKPLKPRAKVVVEALAATFLFVCGMGIHYLESRFGRGIFAAATDLSLTIIWVLLITNAYNLIDGLDGLAAGSAMISALVLLSAAAASHNTLVTFLVVAFIGSLLGFLKFNFYPASIFMGDSGSLFIGFLLSALYVAAPPKTVVGDVAVPLLAFGLPILDVTLAIGRRLIRGTGLFRGDTDHIHHKLSRRGFSHQQTVVTLYAATLGFSLASLLVLSDVDILPPVLFVVAIGVCWGIHYLQYPEFIEIIRPSTRHRQIVTSEARIRRAADALALCSDFRSICHTLQETLQPPAPDAIRLENLGKDGYPVALFHSLRYASDGRWFLEWSERKTDSQQWAFDFHVPTAPHPTVGYASLLRLPPSPRSGPSSDLLAEDFRNGLSQAVTHATQRVKALRKPERNADLNLVRAACRAAD